MELAINVASQGKVTTLGASFYAKGHWMEYLKSFGQPATHRQDVL